MRGGAGLPSDAPGQSRRAQRARHALTEAGSVPGCAPLRRASSISPPAIGSERDVSAERCRAVVLGGAGSPRVVEAPRQRRARAAQAAHAPGAAAPPMALKHEPAGEDERSARPTASMEPVSHRNGAAASPTGTRTTRRAPGAGAAARERVLLVSLQGVIKRGRYCECRPRQKTVRGRPCNLLVPSLGEAKTLAQPQW